MLMFPQIDPVALQLGPVAVHWYGLAYVVALLGGLWLAQKLLNAAPAASLDAQKLDQFLIWAVVGVVVGGRVGYAAFYQLDAFINNPLHILQVWQGGMAFHGGLVGVIAAMLLFCKVKKVDVGELADRVAPVVPLGLLLGRIANFINGELWGRPADPSLPWAMVFPHVDALARHPSQLYQAGFEGILLGTLMLCVVLWQLRRRWVKWLNAGVFLVGYGVARLVGEAFRQYEIIHDFWIFSVTQGQLLSLPMVGGGAVLLGLAWRQRNAAK